MTIILDQVAELDRANVDLRQQLDMCRAELTEARDQQTATAEVLQVINSSPGDLAPVFDAVLYRAMRLCDASFGFFVTVHDQDVELVAQRNVPDRLLEYLTRQPIELDPASQLGQAIQSGRVVHISDDSLSEAYRQGVPHAVAAVELGGVRTVLHVPLTKDSQVLGDLVIFRQEVRPFTDKQIALLRSFAAQAVIAMENARLFGELRQRTRELEESLGYQTATSDVLQVISRSTFDLRPVLDTLVQTAVRLCDAQMGHLAVREDEAYRFVATYSVSPEWDALARDRLFTPGRGTVTGRTLLERRVVHMADCAADPEYAWPEAVTVGKIRTSIGVPLLREGEPMGVLILARQRVEPFTERQIELVRTFADQAVIAIENTRLITETREALEQQTATAEVLQVINSSPGDLAPVFDAMLDKALDLCGAAFGTLWTFDGDCFHAVALRGVPAGFAEVLTQAPYHPEPGSGHERLLRGAPYAQIDDAAAAVGIGPVRRALVELGGARTVIAVPLRKDGAVLGAISAFRQEVHPFTDKQIALLQNFAAQAVIAMENARLLTETREALDQQTATAEVLGVINSSPGALRPVFDAMLEKAMRLCDAVCGHLYTYDGERFSPAAVRGERGFAEWWEQHGAVRPVPGAGPLGRIAQGERVVVTDYLEDPAYRAIPQFKALVDAGGLRSAVAVALRKDDALLGSIHIYRQEVRPFSDKQIALLRNFAAQAVIAMENARLLTETREALEQQTATAEVLQVINSSPGDLAPVFDAMLEKALGLCEATYGHLVTFDGEYIHIEALTGDPRLVNHFRNIGPVRPPSESVVERFLRGEDVVHIADTADDPGSRVGGSLLQALTELGGTRSLFGVALRKDRVLLGGIVVYRQEVRPFGDQQIALLQNFAAQAVIAMENARLLTETREALEQQTATAEVLQVINSSPGDLAPVFDAMLEKAMRLCEAAFGILITYEGGQFHAAALRDVPPRFAEIVREPIRPDPGMAIERILRGENVVVFADVAAEQAYAPGTGAHRFVESSGARSHVTVALRKDGALRGAIVIYRTEVRPFSDKQIALLQNFAAQAVIAMENARLLGELRQRTGDLQESLEYQTAISDVLKVISQSGSELGAVLDTLVGTAARICRAESGFIFRLDDGFHRMIASFGIPPEYKDFQLRNPIGPGRGTLAGRTAIERRAVHIEDAATDPEYIRVQAFALGRQRTMLGAPLVRDDALVGVITLARTRVEPFTQQQIELVTTFADQAVIAIENARLLTELRESLERQQAIAELLQVINSSPGDLAPVFDALLEKATGLCEANYGVLCTYDGQCFHPSAIHGDPQFAEWLRARSPILPRPGSPFELIAHGERFVRIADTETTSIYHTSSGFRELVEAAGIRTHLVLALRKEETLIGAIAIYRKEVSPFTDKQIVLVQNFAAQAVIAMENARLLGELRARTHDLEESLEYQTAISDVLKVISGAAFDLDPVLQTVVTTAIRLCRADQAVLYRNVGGEYRWAAGASLVPEYEHIEREVRIRPGTGTLVGRAASEARTVHILDAWTDPLYEAKPDARVGGIHTMLGVPLLRDGEPIGVIGLARQRVEAYAEREIELVRTFADQAVIAIENTRLLSELRESLEQQQAIAEVLQVINASPGELAPVFDAMLEKAMRLCGAAFGMLHTVDGKILQPVALSGLPPPFGEFATNPANQPGPGGATPRLIRDGGRFVHVLDLKEEEAYRSGDPYRRALVHLGGARTLLAVPLRQDGIMVGVINIYRQEVRPFSDKEIGLLESFGAQAVIAIDNARLLEEIRQRQAELRVTFDNMGDGVAMFDAELRLAAWNRNFQQILDLPDEFVAGRPSFSEYFDYLAVRGEYTSAELEAELRRDVEDTGTELRFERTRPDGRVIEVRRNTVPGGGFVLIYSDITERQRAEAQIRAARDAAEKALGELKTAQASLVHAEKMASLGQLTAGIAHEIKNPLNFVNNFAGLSVELLDELKEAAAPALALLDEERRAEAEDIVATLTGNLDKIAEHGRRADGIVTSMLAHSRGGSGERQPVDINALVEEALNLAYHGARAQDQDFTIALERDFDLGVAPIELVPQDITRVLLNLFNNGFYATSRRRSEANEAEYGPCLKVTTRDLSLDVEIRVHDNGAGIPPEIKDRLFQPFFTTKPTGEGTGLGLSISYDIVTQQHGGTIAVDSRPGEFTEFTIRLPRRAAIRAGQPSLLLPADRPGPQLR